MSNHTLGLIGLYDSLEGYPLNDERIERISGLSSSESMKTIIIELIEAAHVLIEKIEKEKNIRKQGIDTYYLQERIERLKYIISRLVLPI